MIALQNAFYELFQAGSPEEGIVATVGCGGDTDTNSAIAGALLGAAWEAQAVREQWRKGVNQPRLKKYWPVDILDLAEKVVQG